ncbi:MAG: TlpA disulfide reductase family protein [Phycisphaerae bacterium]|nr:TlpA disulfide reductase family protein [Phycisphaerae bacterium]
MFSLQTVILAGLVASASAPVSPTPVAAPPAPTTPVSAPLSNALAPDFALTDLAGRTVRLSDFRGKVVVLEFWASWCAPCQRALPVAAEAVRKAGSNAVLLVIDIDDSETRDKVQRALTAQKLSVQVLLKGNATSRRYGVGPIPHSVVVGKDGKITASHVGLTSEAATQAALSRDIAAALAKS